MHVYAQPRSRTQPSELPRRAPLPSFSATAAASLLFPEHMLPSTVITLLRSVSFLVVLSPRMNARGPYCCRWHGALV